MASVDDVTMHIDTTATRLDGSMAKTQAATTEVEQVIAGIAAAKSEADALAQTLASLGADGKAGEAEQVAARAEELTSTAQATKSTLDTTLGQLGGFKTDLTQLRGQVEALRGLLQSSLSGTTTPAPSAGGAHRRARFGASTSKNYKKTFFDRHPEATGKVVVHHAVEQQSQKLYPGVVTDSEMHSYENLRGIPKGEINNRVHLSAIRMSWNEFYEDNPNPTKQQLLDHATTIDNEHGHQFNPSIR